MRCSPFGVRAVLFELGVGEHLQRASITQRVGHELTLARPEADVVVGAGSVLVVSSEPDGAALGALRDVADRALASALCEAARPLPGATQHDIRVVYDGPDLGELADAAQLAAAEIVERHAGRSYGVEVLGFLPGFAYLGPLDSTLVRPRRSNPRKRVGASSVGVAGAFTGIYPFPSPGGWHLLGRAISPGLFDVRDEPPGRFRVGDRVRFIPVRAEDVEDLGSQSPVARAEADSHASWRGAALELVRVPPGVTIQDLGRIGQMGRGLPPSGALDVETLARANRAVGNHPGAAAIEIPLNRLVMRARREVTVSLDGAPPIVLGSGDELEVAPEEQAVRYVAVQGGFDVPEVLGSRSTLLVAGFGGFEGRMLKQGDRLAVGPGGSDLESVTAAPGLRDETGSNRPDPDGVAVLTAVRGPSEDAFPTDAWHHLERQTFQVSQLGNRVGVRLEGTIPRVGRDAGLPVPMMRGALQVSTDGTPIVLGPDHAVTGGYPVIAVLTPAAITRLAQLRPGRSVRFELVGPTR